MWFLFSLVAVVFWGGSDLFSKLGSPPADNYSHMKIVSAVGLVMGIHATAEIISGAEFHYADFLNYLPATALYISSMILGYIGLRYIMLSVSSPICNSSGAVACILCLIFLREIPNALGIAGILLVCIGVTMLAVIEKQNGDTGYDDGFSDKYKKGFIAVFFPIFYCVLDGLGTFADALLLDSGKLSEESANIAYEYTFLFIGVICAVYVFAIKREKIKIKYDAPKLGGALCETAGQFAYIYAIGSNPTAAAPMISSYCIFSVLLSRIFLKEKLSAKHYFVVAIVLTGIVFLGFAETLG